MRSERDQPADANGSDPARSPARPRAGKLARFWAAVLAICCASVLGVAIRLKPDPRGYGTHQQLGAAPCGMIMATGLPCPTCGMTTAFSHTVRGQWWSASRAQPAGFILALATFVTIVLASRAAMTGYWPRALLNDRVVFRLLMALLVLLVAGWGIKLLVGFLDHSLPIRSVRL